MKLVPFQEMLWEIEKWGSGGSTAIPTRLSSSHCGECCDTVFIKDLAPLPSHTPYSVNHGVVKNTQRNHFSCAV